MIKSKNVILEKVFSTASYFTLIFKSFVSEMILCLEVTEVKVTASRAKQSFIFLNYMRKCNFY